MAFDSTSVAVLSDVPAVVAPVVVPAKAVRIAPLPYDERQSVAHWTANDAESRTLALWLAIAPIMSAYLINGGTAASLRGEDGASKLAALIHTTPKGRRNAAARATFGQCVKTYKARSCEYSQDAHDSAMVELELVFMQALAPASTGTRKPAAKKFTVQEFAELIASGALDASDMALIVGAIPPSAMVRTVGKAATV